MLRIIRKESIVKGDKQKSSI